MTNTLLPEPHEPGQPAVPPPDNNLGDETNFEQKEVAGLSQGQIVRRRFFRHKPAMISLVLLVLVILLATTSIGWGPIPGWWQYSYTDTPGSIAGNGASISVFFIGGHDFFSLGGSPFGTDQLGHDNFAQVMRGIQQTTVVLVVLGLLSTVIGVVLGALAGYYRGWVDSVIMRFTDLIITLPILLITAVLGVAFHAHGVFSVAFALGFLSWMQLARLVRAEFLTLREREFVDAARVAGASDRRIIFKHILPNTVSVIVVNVTLVLAAGILTEAALAFLNFGIQSPDVSLGLLISTNKGAIATGKPYLFLWPGVFIIIIAMTLNFIGDGLRDAFDPRQKRIPKMRELRTAEKIEVLAPPEPPRQAGAGAGS